MPSYVHAIARFGCLSGKGNVHCWASNDAENSLGELVMHVNKPTVLEKLRLSRFSATEDGMHVEASVFSSNPAESTRVLFTFREDEHLGMQVVLHGSGNIAFPLEELKAAIRYAEAEVHKESFYDLLPSQFPGDK